MSERRRGNAAVDMARHGKAWRAAAWRSNAGTPLGSGGNDVVATVSKSLKYPIFKLDKLPGRRLCFAGKSVELPFFGNLGAPPIIGRGALDLAVRAENRILVQ